MQSKQLKIIHLTNDTTGKRNSRKSFYKQIK